MQSCTVPVAHGGQGDFTRGEWRQVIQQLHARMAETADANEVSLHTRATDIPGFSRSGERSDGSGSRGENARC